MYQTHYTNSIPQPVCVYLWRCAFSSSGYSEKVVCTLYISFLLHDIPPCECLPFSTIVHNISFFTHFSFLFHTGIPFLHSYIAVHQCFIWMKSARDLSVDFSLYYYTCFVGVFLSQRVGDAEGGVCKLLPTYVECKVCMHMISSIVVEWANLWNHLPVSHKVISHNESLYLI